MFVALTGRCNNMKYLLIALLALVRTNVHALGIGQGAGGGGSDSTKVSKVGDTMTGNLVISSAALQIDGNAAVPIQVGVSSLTLRLNGRLGIGTTNPASKLDVTDNWALSQNGSKILASSGTWTILGLNAGLTGGGVLGNTFIGVQAGQNNVSGTINTYVGYQAGMAALGTGNTYIGEESGASSAAGGNSTAVGYAACYNNEGNFNLCFGYNAGLASSGMTGSNNTLIGNETGKGTTSGNNNTFIGFNVAETNPTGASNVAIGSLANAVSTGSFNVYLGASAGYNNDGDSNVFIGYNVGNTNYYYSNKLMIDNSDNATPLIFGDFSENSLQFNGSTQFGTTGASISSFTAAGYFTPAKFTKASIDALSGVLGAVIICTDCTRPYDVCVGTGTGASQWRVSGAAGGCGTNN